MSSRRISLRRSISTEKKDGVSWNYPGTIEVAEPYVNVRMSIFNYYAHTIRIVKPFVWKDTYLKVHPNGAAVFAEDKKLAFLLPLIVEAHNLLPPTPIFWVRDDKTIPLARTTMWLHDQTIQWLAETGEAYPQELRSEIQPYPAAQHHPLHNGVGGHTCVEAQGQWRLLYCYRQPGGNPSSPRLDEIKLSRQARKQPPPPPKPNRWQEKSKEKLAAQESQEPTVQASQTGQPSPRQLAAHDRQYMELQAAFALMSKQTAAASKPARKQSKDSAEPAGLSLPTTDEVNKTSQPVRSQATGPTGQLPQGDQQPPKISAQSLADQRPAPPSPLSVPKPKMDALDAPGTGELSNQSSVHTESKSQPPLGQGHRSGEAAKCTTPEDSPTESSNTLATETVVVSSPEPTHGPAYDEDLSSADILTLQRMQREASENVATLTTQLTTAVSTNASMALQCLPGPRRGILSPCTAIASERKKRIARKGFTPQVLEGT